MIEKIRTANEQSIAKFGVTIHSPSSILTLSQREKSNKQGEVNGKDISSRTQATSDFYLPDRAHCHVSS
jgi:hypothetical protein